MFALGSLVGLPNVAFSVFEWLVRMLPGRLVIFGLETIALTGLFASAALAGMLFFVLVDPGNAARAPRRGVVLGGLAGGIVLVIVYAPGTPSFAGGFIIDALWVAGVCLVWG